MGSRDPGRGWGTTARRSMLNAPRTSPYVRSAAKKDKLNFPEMGAGTATSLVPPSTSPVLNPPMCSSAAIRSAGTSVEPEGNFVADGGRVLGVTAKGRDVEEA